MTKPQQAAFNQCLPVGFRLSDEPEKERVSHWATSVKIDTRRREYCEAARPLLHGNLRNSRCGKRFRKLVRRCCLTFLLSWARAFGEHLDIGSIHARDSLLECRIASRLCSCVSCFIRFLSGTDYCELTRVSCIILLPRQRLIRLITCTILGVPNLGV